MRMILALGMAMLALAMATPAAAQTQGIAGLEWLSGTWCGEGAKEAKVCLIFTPDDNRTIIAEWRLTRKASTKPEQSFAVLRVTDGRVVLHSDDQGSDYVEVSRGPGELLMRHAEEEAVEKTGGDLDQVRYRVTDGALFIDFVYVDGKVETGRYLRED